MTFTAILADDEQNLTDYLKSRLNTFWPALNIVATAANGAEALRLIDDHAPDVVFLDIKMPGLTGLEVAGRIDPKTHVVFVTAYDQYAVDAFDKQAVDYLLKPVTDDRLQRAIARLKDKLTKKETPQDVSAILASLAKVLPQNKSQHLRWIRASVGELTKQIAVDDVLYFQAQDKYVSVYIKEGAREVEALIRTPLSELIEQLDNEAFWQIHRSIVVNVSRIAGTTRDTMGHTIVKIKDSKAELQVSRAYTHLFKQM
ncbi:MAG: response regulator transcription factor [Gammaproteobacteria bacterium]|nr:response regulator transcription factor [Gammaproteobacteria bacterium]